MAPQGSKECNIKHKWTGKSQTWCQFQHKSVSQVGANVLRAEALLRHTTAVQSTAKAQDKPSNAHEKQTSKRPVCMCRIHKAMTHDVGKARKEAAS